jgi:hypothetical protein
MARGADGGEAAATPTRPAQARGADAREQQDLTARITGNFKRGNERRGTHG